MSFVYEAFSTFNMFKVINIILLILKRDA